METQAITTRQAIIREIRSALGRAGLTQRELAKQAGFSTSNLSEKMNGKLSFSVEDLLTVAGVLGLSLTELLGEALTSQRVPSPSYFEDEKGKKKVAPIGFIPTGTTYEMVANTAPVLAGVGPAGLEPATKGL